MKPMASIALGLVVCLPSEATAADRFTRASSQPVARP